MEGSGAEMNEMGVKEQDTGLANQKAGSWKR